MRLRPSILWGFLIIFILGMSANIIFKDDTETKVPAVKADGDIRGWNILSDDYDKAINAIAATKDYGVNHLQLSHEIVHDLMEIREPAKQQLVNQLIKEAHDNNIDDVFVWDHALYGLDYYPEKFKSAEGGRIDLDNPEFWHWLKDDYRDMLSLAPELDGIILTFIETGGRIEEQYSLTMKTRGEKLAKLVDEIADVVIEELGLKLYIRTFIYNRADLASMIESLQLIDNKDLTVMIKETPHDFFITHPTQSWIDQVPYPVIIEFDATHEFNGQGVVSSIFPAVHMKRWQHYQQFNNVKGFVIRTDRYGSTSILGRAPEVNIYGIHAASRDPNADAATVTKDFLTKRYGVAAATPLLEVFQMAPEIILSSFYTLGLNTTNHSKLDFKYRSIYTRHVSGRWLDEPTIKVDHGVNKTFHYWKDVVEHLSPIDHKRLEGTNKLEVADVFANGWLSPDDQMNTAYFDDVVTQKNHSLALAEKALTIVESVEGLIADKAAYRDLHELFTRTLLAVRMRRAAATVYYGSRVENSSQNIKSAIDTACSAILITADDVESFKGDVPVGQYDWHDEAPRGRAYHSEYCQ